MITIISKDLCSKCDQVKAYLHEKGIEFREDKITNDLIKLTYWREQHPGKGFPIVIFDNDEEIAGDVEEIKNKISLLE